MKILINLFLLGCAVSYLVKAGTSGIHTELGETQLVLGIYVIADRLDDILREVTK